MKHDTTVREPRQRSLTARDRALILLVVTWLLPFLGIVPGASGQSSYPESELKAAFLFSFVKYVEWPREVLEDSADSMVLCVVGEHPFGEALEQIEGRQVHRRRLQISRVSEPSALEGCHVVFVSTSEEYRVDTFLDRLRNASVLTVSDIEGFAERGGIIDMFRGEDTVRFSINLEAADRANLVVSSRLLALAQLVDGP